MLFQMTGTVFRFAPFCVMITSFMSLILRNAYHRKFTAAAAAAADDDDDESVF